MKTTKRFGTIVAALSLLVAFAALPLAASDSAYHKYFMKGAIIESSEEGVYLCIGTANGAKVGEELDVVRVSRVGNGGAKGQPPKFQRQTVGKVRIDAIVDEHFARATVLSGEAREHDVAELKEK